jgi:hypothetical protein
MRKLAVLQWVGLLAGAGLWWSAHVVGFGIAEARCSSGGSNWGIDFDLWEALANGLAAALLLGAAGASVAVIRQTADASYEDAPPVGRVRFFAIAALAANVIFLAIVVLYAIAATGNVLCRQA